MNKCVCSAEVIYVDAKGQRFSVLMTKEQTFVPAHWIAFRRAGVSSVVVGERYVVSLAPDPRDEQTAIVHEVVSLDEAFSQKYREPTKSYFCFEEPPDAQNLLSALMDSGAPKIFSNFTLNEPFEHSGLSISSTVIFADCTFLADFRLVDAKIQGDLWFLNCSFSQHFNLRGLRITGNVALFGCDFSGAGGISFRGVRGRSIFLIYGIRGSSDMLWMNELVLHGSAVIEGSFGARIQFRGRQSFDEEPLNQNPQIRRIVVGRTEYSAEHLGENRYEGGIEIRDYHVAHSIEIENSHIDELVLEDLSCGSLLVDNCRIARDLVAKNVKTNRTGQEISLSHNNIERHLQVSGRSLDCKLILDGTWVGQTWRLELLKPECGVPRVSLKRFIAGSAFFEPVHLVYGSRRQYHFLRPPDFGMLEGAGRSFPLDLPKRLEIGEAYTSCKNWLALSGHLREEDHAFFYMRNAKESSAWRRFTFGVVFGWGIYLRNIVISAFLVVCMFALIFFSLGLSLDAAAMLSAQSFIASFFGEWPSFSPTGLVSWVATTESLVGVLYITVIVGAYVRKLLR